MTLLPLALLPLCSVLLRPLRALVARGWLRESDVDAWLALLNPGLRLNRVMARVEARRWVAEDMLALTLRANANWRGAQPGQHLQLYIERDGIRLGRSYSLIAVGADGSLQIAIKRQAGGRVSPYLLERLAVGTWLELGAVQGELHWPGQAPGVLLLAAGSGLTPLLGLLRRALAQGFAAPVTLLHYVREQGQRAFVEELQALQARHANLQVRWALTGEGAAQAELQGRFAAEHLQDISDAAQRAVLSCGPAGFVGAVRQWWQAVGGQAELQVEAFTPPPLSAGSERRVVQLGLARSRQVLSAHNQASLLEQAEAHGLRPAHGCRQGICASCTCTLVSGVVRDMRSGELLAEPGQAIRLCISAPQGDVEIDL